MKRKHLRSQCMRRKRVDSGGLPIRGVQREIDAANVRGNSVSQRDYSRRLSLSRHRISGRGPTEVAGTVLLAGVVGSAEAVCGPAKVVTPLRVSWMANNAKGRSGAQYITRFELLASRYRDRLSTRGDETFRGFHVVEWKHINYVMAGEGRGSINANQVHGDK